jgi:hypothetical protein
MKGRDHLEDLNIEGSIILKRIFKEMWWVGIGFICFRNRVK